MRVVFLNPIGEIGGAERVLLNMIWGLRQTETTMDVSLLTGSDGPLAHEAARLGASATVVDMPAVLRGMGESQRLRDHGARRLARAGWSALRAASATPCYVARLASALRRAAPDIVHSNGVKTHVLSALAAPRDARVVWHIHDFLSRRRLSPKVLRALSRRVTSAIAVSRAVADDARRALAGVDVRLLANTIDLDRFQPAAGDGAELDRRAGLPPAANDTLRIGLVATYAIWKGHHVFLRAAARAKRALGGSTPVRFYIVGGPIYHTPAQHTLADLRIEVDTLHLADDVGFIPFSNDTAEIYRALDVVAHTSTEPEAFGLTIAEAMACGRAVIVSNAGGAAELFTDEHDALGVSPGDEARLADAMIRLAKDAPLRERLGRQAAITARRCFDRAHVTRDLLEIYQHVSRPRPSALESAPT